jgi:1-acyl-sn-glycerol-3-phosphate acyltransferase
MRTALALLTAVVISPVLVFVLAVLRLLRVKDEPGGIYERIPAIWSRAILDASGVRVRVHGGEQLATGEPRIFVCNHVSWFDVFAMAAALGGGTFVAKSELYRIPVFGAGMRLVGIIRIERENRKAAFASYEVAAERIRRGTSVVVFPEGTRGHTYALRPFKKGPFVLAIAAGVPLVPVIAHGTIEVMSRGSMRVRPGLVDLHFLEPVPTTGYSYDDRDQLLSIVHDRMEAAMGALYKVGADRKAAQPATT